ncbi:hypothetical protein M514_11197 [Trichuris suis]|uniref:Uncharacterized protein n=1 Tax=Trichuris suis TaxID=68888 RepID=A0A085LSG0_9BILA|nr:hypothetical protein M513_11197 [Trichuris suis]KFD59583.1 hypothetical protein M514_11197 [Trichuris suis]
MKRKDLVLRRKTNVAERTPADLEGIVYDIGHYTTFCGELKSINLGPTDIMVSYDVKDLFTSLPIPETLQILLELLSSDETLPQRTKLNPFHSTLIRHRTVQYGISFMTQLSRSIRLTHMTGTSSIAEGSTSSSYPALAIWMLRPSNYDIPRNRTVESKSAKSVVTKKSGYVRRPASQFCCHVWQMEQS